MTANRWVYIVDDDEAIRHSLLTLLGSEGYSVRAFGSGQEFLAAAPTLGPGCLIIDVRMPGMDGLEVQARLAEGGFDFPIIVMTGHGDIPLAVKAMKAGAADFIEKPFAGAIIDSLDAAFSRLAAAGDRTLASAEAAAKLARLSAREREVLEGLLAGLPNKSLAYSLGISPRTVEIHRARVMDKMGARSLSELIQMALAAGVQARTS
jgi:two-component system, LuxR family, response regulator FixJ